MKPGVQALVEVERLHGEMTAWRNDAYRKAARSDRQHEKLAAQVEGLQEQLKESRTHVEYLEKVLARVEKEVGVQENAIAATRMAAVPQAAVDTWGRDIVALEQRVKSLEMLEKDK